MRPAALLGQNNKSILVDLAGLSESELTELENLGVVTTEPPLCRLHNHQAVALVVVQSLTHLGTEHLEPELFVETAVPFGRRH